MANLTITAADVKLDTEAGSPVLLKLAASVSGLVTAGTVLVSDGANELVKAVCTSAALSGGTAGTTLYIALSAGYAGQYISVVSSRDIKIGATTILALMYCLSATSGLICPYADLVTGNWVVYLGWAPATDRIRMSPIITGKQIP